MRRQVLNTLLVELMRSDEVLTQYLQDPAALAARHGLTGEERDRLVARDMGWLYLQGVEPYILTQFALSIRYDMAMFTTQIKAAAGRAVAAS
jgi:hypothetical protein